MNKSPLPKVLLAVLTILALWSLVLCYMFINRARQFRELQAQVNAINVRQQAFRFLVNDLAEYSRKNAAMEPILQSIGVRLTATNPAPAAATRTGSK